MKSFLTFLFLAALISCGNTQQQNAEKEQQLVENSDPVEVSTQNGLKKAYFASGCFWCVGIIYEHVIGVKKVIYGYSGGHTQNPTYEASNTGKTGHAESVEVTYDPDKVSFATLVDVYFGSQNVTQQNGQGPDTGSQYRSILFYQNEKQKQIIEEKIAALNPFFGKPIAAEVMPFQKFWKAEEYHQDYAEKNPNSRYIQNVSVPRYNEFKEKFPELIKENKKIRKRKNKSEDH